MTTTEIAKLIDTPYTVRLKKLTFNVKIKDAKMNYGRVLIQVTPVAGRGDDWFEYVPPVGGKEATQ